MEKERKKVGRKGKYTPETVEKIVQAVRMGATYEHAAAYAGIAYGTFFEWMNVHPEFAEAVKSAEGEGAVVLFERLQRAAQEGTWQAAAWILERRHPGMYGRRVIQHEGNPDQPLRIEVVYREDDPD